MHSTDKPKVRQLLRHISTTDNSNSEASRSSLSIRDNHNRGTTNTQRAHYVQSLEGAYKSQYSCPPPSVNNTPAYTCSTDMKKDVAAYVLQPDGTMAAVRWDDKSALENNSALLVALKQEQQAQLQGQTTGRIQNTGNSKATLPADMLNWLASDEDSFSSQSDSSKGRSNVSSGQLSEREFVTPSAPLLSPIVKDCSSDQDCSSDTTQYSGAEARPGEICKHPAKRNNIKIISSSSLATKKNNSNRPSATSSLQLQFTHPNIITTSSHQYSSTPTSSHHLDSTTTSSLQHSSTTTSSRHVDSTATSSPQYSSTTASSRHLNSTTTSSPQHSSTTASSRHLDSTTTSSPQHSSTLTSSRQFNSTLSSGRQPMQVANQVQESFWSPQVSASPNFDNQSNDVRQQQRQLSVERASRQQLNSKERKDNSETSVWEYFKGYDRCATSDF
ncbi:uncharacterized protein [Watersipora subatra]|uniref:uncharacterized protein n=1 Tax=Watersipora subatra TaxID=2589382 RepID=UPI00355B658B